MQEGECRKGNAGSGNAGSGKGGAVIRYDQNCHEKQIYTDNRRIRFNSVRLSRGIRSSSSRGRHSTAVTASDYQKIPYFRNNR